MHSFRCFRIQATWTFDRKRLDSSFPFVLLLKRRWLTIKVGIIRTEFAQGRPHWRSIALVNRGSRSPFEGKSIPTSCQRWMKQDTSDRGWWLTRNAIPIGLKTLVSLTGCPQFASRNSLPYSRYLPSNWTLLIPRLIGIASSGHGTSCSRIRSTRMSPSSIQEAGRLAGPALFSCVCWTINDGRIHDFSIFSYTTISGICLWFWGNPMRELKKGKKRSRSL